jgi:hypothetical protein
VVPSAEGLTRSVAVPPRDTRISQHDNDVYDPAWGVLKGVGTYVCALVCAVRPCDQRSHLRGQGADPRRAGRMAHCHRHASLTFLATFAINLSWRQWSVRLDRDRH